MTQGSLAEDIKAQLRAAAAKIEIPDAVKDQVRSSAHTQQSRSEAESRWADTAIKALQIAGHGGFPGYAERNLRIRDKTGELRALTFKPAQYELDRLANEQLSTQGYVRLIVVKARQMGISTYIAGRGYWKTTRKTGQKAYILAHELNASGQLFKMVKGFHDYIDPRYRPHTQRSNAKELIFDQLRGGYAVGTAKQGDTGRSLTVQFFHGSEVGFWPSADSIALGLLQTIGTVKGTEIWMESTGNGMGNYFHSAAMQARKAQGDFRLAFLPWYWDPDYRRPFLMDEERSRFLDGMTVEDMQYMEGHGVSAEQMAWRAAKIDEFAMAAHGNVEVAKVKFAQEYPANVEEAFSGNQTESYIQAMSVILARKAWRTHLEAHPREPRPQGYGPKRMGIDPSWVGNDGFRIWMRQGRVAWRVGKWEKAKLTESLGRIMKIVERERPDEIYIDAVGIGAGLYDMLSETRVGGIVTPVMSGDSADEPDRYFNKRAEMTDRVREWLTEAPQSMLEDIDEIQADLTSVRAKRDQRHRVRVESKDEMRARGIPSPDDLDALALTFAYASPVLGRGGSGNTPSPNRPVNYGGNMTY